MKFILVFSLSLLLAACSVTTPRDVGKDNMISLPAVACKVPERKYRGAITVKYPSVASELDTFRIAVSKADGRKDYIAGARWNEFLPSVVHAALVNSLVNCGYFQHVQSDESSAPAKYSLFTEIEEFRVVYSSATLAPKVWLRIAFRLFNAQDKKTLQSFVLTKEAQAERNTLSSIMDTFHATFVGLVAEAIRRL